MRGLGMDRSRVRRGEETRALSEALRASAVNELPTATA